MKSSLNRVSSLKELLKQKKCVKILEAHNGLSGLVVENSEFDGMWESSLTDSASKGLPDIELVGMESRLETIRQILDVTTKPIIVDGDTGGQIEHFPYYVRWLENAGVSAVIIEDKAFPKQNSLDELAKHRLEDVDMFSEKISSGVQAKKNSDFMIIARLESLIAEKSMYEALVRAEAFLKAGADGIVIHSKAKVDADDIFEFAEKTKDLLKDKALVCIPTTYNHITDKKLEEAGFNIIIHANHLLRASLKAMEDTASEIHKQDCSKSLDDKITAVKKVFDTVGYGKKFYVE